LEKCFVKACKLAVGAGTAPVTGEKKIEAYRGGILKGTVSWEGYQNESREERENRGVHGGFMCVNTVRKKGRVQSVSREKRWGRV